MSRDRKAETERSLDVIGRRTERASASGKERPGAWVHASGLVELLRFFKTTKEPTFAAAARLAALVSSHVAQGNPPPPPEVRVALRAIGTYAVTVGKTILEVVDALDAGANARTSLVGSAHG